MKLIQANDCVIGSLVSLSSAKVNCLLYFLELFGLELNLHFQHYISCLGIIDCHSYCKSFENVVYRQYPFLWFTFEFVVSFKEVVWFFAKDFFHAFDYIWEKSSMIAYFFVFPRNICFLFFNMFLLYIIWRRLHWRL